MPAFNYVVINPLPSLSGSYKMSKTLPKDSIPLSIIFRVNEVAVPQHVYKYVFAALSLADKVGIRDDPAVVALKKIKKGDSND